MATDDFDFDAAEESLEPEAEFEPPREALQVRENARSAKALTRYDLSAYVELIEQGYTPKLARRKVDVSEGAIRYWRENDEGFDLALREIEQDQADQAEAALVRRMLDDDDPASSKLLMFYLRSIKPERYGDKIEIRRGVDAVAEKEAENLQRWARANPDQVAKQAAVFAQAMRENEEDQAEKIEDAEWEEVEDDGKN